MSPTKIKKLTAEQEALIPVYREKWRLIALSTEPLDCAARTLRDRQKATEAVKAAYAAIGFKEPEIIFCDSPNGALNTVGSQLSSQLCEQLGSQLGSQLGTQLGSQLWSQLSRQLGSQLLDELLVQLGSQLWRQMSGQMSGQMCEQVGSQLSIELWNEMAACMQSELLACYGGFFDFCIAGLNCVHEQREWSALQLLVNHCGWIFPFEKSCFVCSRPIFLSVDSEYRLHALCEPAMKFADGYSLYSYHGVTLPEKYGAVHPHQWRAQWLLEEDNAEIRRVLIQGIGYDRIARELQAIELDSWQEYTLLGIDNDLDEEPIYLLKMTCPSTGFIHALRVPPEVNSAREAIRWVNWGISPEEFSIQT